MIGIGPRAVLGGRSPAAEIASRAPAAWFRRGMGVTITGAGVSQWDDQSGNGRHLKQGTDTNRPALQADGSILFDGVDNFLKCDAFTLNQPLSIQVAGQALTWSASDRWFDGNTGSSVALYQQGTTPTTSLFAGSANVSVSPALGADAVLTCVANGASSVVQLNNGTPVTGNAGTNNAAGFTLGAAPTPGNYGHIQIKEVAIFASALDAATRFRLVRALATLNGIAA